MPLHQLVGCRLRARAAPRNGRAGRPRGCSLAQSSSAKSITARPAVGNFSIRRWRASTSPDAISRLASSAIPGLWPTSSRLCAVRGASLTMPSSAFGSGVVDARLGDDLRRPVERRQQKVERLGHARCRRGDDQVRHQRMPHHVGAHFRRGFAAARVERAVMVAQAGLGPVGFGVAQQHQAAHRRLHRFRWSNVARAACDKHGIAASRDDDRTRTEPVWPDLVRGDDGRGAGAACAHARSRRRCVRDRGGPRRADGCARSRAARLVGRGAGSAAGRARAPQAAMAASCRRAFRSGSTRSWSASDCRARRNCGRSPMPASNTCAARSPRARCPACSRGTGACRCAASTTSRR